MQEENRYIFEKKTTLEYPSIHLTTYRGGSILDSSVDKKLKKSLAYANREEIPYVIVLGDDELAGNYFILKNMDKGEETKIELDNLNKVKEVIKMNRI